MAMLITLSSGTFTESISGSGLLGDHSGVPSINASFDYVVVGGGTAGLTVAMRLAENGSFSVAVVEADGFYELRNGNLSTVPGTAGYFVGTAPAALNPLIDWGYQAEPNLVGRLFLDPLGLPPLLMPTGSRRPEYTLQLREEPARR